MTTFQTTLFGLATACLFALQGAVVTAQEIPEKKRTKAGLYLTATEAAAMLEDPAVLFIDVRTRPEVAFLGLPERVDVHIPYMTMLNPAAYDPEEKTYAMEPNPDFLFVFEDYAMERDLAEDTPIVIMCRSGSRSARVANLLYDVGYRNVYSVIDGFEGDKNEDGPEKGHRMVNGWKNAGLRWSYAIAPSQAYPGDRM